CLSSPLSSRFCFSLSHHHPGLHPFPTRRSSDLCPRGLIASAPFSTTSAARGISAVTTRSPASTLCTIKWSATSKPAPTCTDLIRSEEHTSELQSRENLVCRLLLETKKNNIHPMR